MHKRSQLDKTGGANTRTRVGPDDGENTGWAAAVGRDTTAAFSFEGPRHESVSPKGAPARSSSAASDRCRQDDGTPDTVSVGSVRPCGRLPASQPEVATRRRGQSDPTTFVTFITLNIVVRQTKQKRLSDRLVHVGIEVITSLSVNRRR